MTMDLQETLRRGVIAAKAGRQAEAQELLIIVVKADQQQLQAWLWLSRVVDSEPDKIICFENILALDPNSDYARQGLAQLEAEDRQAIDLSPAFSEQHDIQDQYSTSDQSQKIMSRQQAIAGGYLADDVFDSEWLCPYCAASTGSDDTTCTICQRKLILRTRRSPERTVWLWRGFFLQAYTAFYSLVAGLAYFTVLTKLYGVPNPLLLLPLYLGLDVDQPQAYIDLALMTLPRFYFWLLISAAGYSLALLLILFFRLPFGHFFYVINTGIMFMLSLSGLLFGGWWPIQFLALIGLALGIGQLIIGMNLWDDFSYVDTRLRAQVDSDATNHLALYESGRKYANLALWGNVVLHLRRAVGLCPNDLRYQLALAVAYINIKRYDLAQQSLNDAESLAPQAEEVQQLRTRLKREAVNSGY